MATESLAVRVSAVALLETYSIRKRELISLSVAASSTASPTLSKWVGLEGSISAESDCYLCIVYVASLIGAYGRVLAAMTIPEEALEDTEIGYFLGAYGGGVHEWSDSYKGDAGTAISAYWQSRDLDFDDQIEGMGGLYKTIEKVKLYFVDTNETDITLSVSTDDGLTWTDKTKTLGTGTNDPSEYIFDFWTTGHRFRFKIANSSASDNFQFVRLEAAVIPQGEYFVVSA